MLFDTLKKKNRAEAEEQAWNANRPADYVSQNKDAMDAVTGQVGSGFDWDTGSKAYEQYRSQSTANAAASAENARANAAALAGGYGSSYADSVAKQGQQQAMGTIDNAVPGLRSQALSEYQNSQNSLLNALSGMASTEALDRSAYGANLSNYENWQNFLANQSEQARNENDNYWNNLWNGILTAGNVVKSAYDGYMGYTYQEEQLALQKQAAQQQAVQTALNLKAAGGDELAKSVLADAGLDSSLLDNYTGAPVTWEDKLKWIQNASSMTANGDQKGAQTMLNILGMEPDSIATRDDVANWAFDDYARKQSFVKTLSGSSSGSRSSSGSGSSKSSGGWTNPQLRQIASDYRKMSDTDELKPTYRKILQDAGWLEEDTGSTGSQSGGSIGLAAQKELNQSSKWAPLAANTGSQTAAKSSADRLVQGYSKKGYSAWAIANLMSGQGYSDAEIAQALEKAGVQ